VILEIRTKKAEIEGGEGLLVLQSIFSDPCTPESSKRLTTNGLSSNRFRRQMAVKTTKLFEGGN
jgi:hypothetical protein